MDTTIEIRLQYSLNGSWVWTKTISQDKDRLHYSQTKFDSLKDRKKSLDNFIENKRWRKESKHKILKQYGVKKGWQFAFLIRDTNGINLKKWHGFKITSRNFEVDYDKVAEKKDYVLIPDHMFPWPHECK